jgi:hypothetical protein
MLSWSITTGAQGSSDAIEVAGIHATIIAIFMAVAVGYAGVVYGSVHAMKDDILDKATEATRNRVNISVGRDDHAGYDGRDTVAREQLVANILHIARRAPAYLVRIEPMPEQPLDERVPQVDEVAKRAKYVVAALSLLLHNYPLQGKRFKSLTEVREWLPEIELLLENVFVAIGTPWAYLVSIVEAAAAEERASEQNVPLGGPLAATVQWWNQVLDPSRLLGVFRQALVDAQEEARAVEARLARYDGYRSRLAPAWKIGLAVALATLAFVTGVAVPLIDTGAPRWIYVGVPLGVYLVALVVAAVLLVGWYRGTGDET